MAMTYDKRCPIGWRWWFVQYIPSQTDRRWRIAARSSRRTRMEYPRYHDEWIWFPRKIYANQSKIPPVYYEVAIWPH